MAVAWASLGALAATVVASFFYLGTKVDSLGAELRGAISAQGAELSARIEALAQRIDALNARLDAHLTGHRHTG